MDCGRGYGDEHWVDDCNDVLQSYPEIYMGLNEVHP